MAQSRNDVVATPSARHLDVVSDHGDAAGATRDKGRLRRGNAQESRAGLPHRRASTPIGSAPARNSSSIVHDERDAAGAGMRRTSTTRPSAEPDAQATTTSSSPTSSSHTMPAVASLALGKARHAARRRRRATGVDPHQEVESGASEGNANRPTASAVAVTRRPPARFFERHRRARGGTSSDRVRASPTSDAEPRADSRSASWCASPRRGSGRSGAAAVVDVATDSDPRARIDQTTPPAAVATSKTAASAAFVDVFTATPPVPNADGISAAHHAPRSPPVSASRRARASAPRRASIACGPVSCGAATRCAISRIESPSK